MTLAFDVYGTLIDTQGVVTELEKVMGREAEAFSKTWRDKQLEYSFRRGLMNDYQPFSVCTRDALNYSLTYYEIELSDEEKNRLLNSYKILPAFKEVKNGLERLNTKGYKLYAFSNGTFEAVEELLVLAGIRKFFIDIVSVDTIKTFKPSPLVYGFLLEKTKAKREDTWLISSNSFDVIGANSFGLKTIWIQRSEENLFDPWDVEPTIRSNCVEEIANYYLDLPDKFV